MSLPTNRVTGDIVDPVDINNIAETVNAAVYDHILPSGSGSDLDTITTPGAYAYWGGNTNTPSSSSGTVVVSNLGATTNVTQLAYEYGQTAGAKMWTRFRGSAGWSQWVRVDALNRLPYAVIASGENLDAYTTPGVYGYWGSSLNTPSGRSGTVIVSNLGATTTVTQIAFEYGEMAGGVIWYRFRGSSSWSPWVKIGGPSVASLPPPPATSSAMMKTIPLALTVGGSINTYPVTTGGVRMPVRFGARVTRWRLHLRNINPREGTPGTGTVNVTGVWWGKGDGTGNFIDGTVHLAPAMSSTGTDMVTPWTSTPLEPDTDYLIAYGWTATTATKSVVGGGWRTATTSGATTNSAPKTSVTSMPLDVWIEAETAATTPVVAAFGDSLSSGVGATLPVHDSWLSIYCRDNSFLPVHYTASGDTMQSWSNGEHYKWTRWAGLSRADAAIHMMGSNDIFNGATLSEVQSRFQQTLELLTSVVSPVIYAARILPRSGETGAPEDVRRAYNSWLQGQVRDLFDTVTPISLDDENISPGFDADGIHLNTLGYQTIAQQAFPRPVVTA